MTIYSEIDFAINFFRFSKDFEKKKLYLRYIVSDIGLNAVVRDVRFMSNLL